MTTAEIKALVAEIQSANKAYKCVPNYMADSACAAIETLLAREAEVLARCDAVSRISLAGFLTDDIRAILNPQTPSIRDTAAAHGFDAMPSDLAQRSVDGETNYVRLNPENDT